MLFFGHTRLDHSLNRQRAAIAILGSYPPPTGGVSVHVQRLCPLLDTRGISYVVYNAVSGSHDGDRVVSVYRHRRMWMLKFALTAQEPVIYILSSRISAWLAGAFMAVFRRKRVLVRLRNSTLSDIMKRSRYGRICIRFALSKITAIVTVSRFLAESASKLGVHPKKIFHVPGFLPPLNSETQRQNVHHQVWKFAAAREPLIVANGKVAWHAEEDLYALDQLVELASRLNKDYPNIGIVVCFSHHSPGDAPYLEKLLRLAKAKGVAHNILFNTIPGPFIPVLQASDIFVRPTNTDGDANSVREALYFGVPTVASNAAERPEGVIVFRSRDIDDFESKVRVAIGNIGSEKSQQPRRIISRTSKHVDYYVRLLEAVVRGDDSLPQSFR